MDRFEGVSPQIQKDCALSAAKHGGGWAQELKRVIAEAELAVSAGLLESELTEALIDTESHARMATNRLTAALKEAYAKQKRG